MFRLTMLLQRVLQFSLGTLQLFSRLKLSSISYSIK